MTWYVVRAATRQEEWWPIPGYEGQYEVSDAGRVRSLDRVVVRSDGVEHPYPGKLLRPRVKPDGRHEVWLSGQRRWLVHRLVLLAFRGAAPLGHEAAHNDGDPGNNALSNLRWATKSSNMADKVAHGTDMRGVKHRQAKLSPDQVRDIRRRAPSGVKKHLAAEFGISESALHDILSGRSWASVTQ